MAASSLHSLRISSSASLWNLRWVLIFSALSAPENLHRGWLHLHELSSSGLNSTGATCKPSFLQGLLVLVFALVGVATVGLVEGSILTLLTESVCLAMKLKYSSLLMPLSIPSSAVASCSRVACSLRTFISLDNTSASPLVGVSRGLATLVGVSTLNLLCLLAPASCRGVSVSAARACGDLALLLSPRARRHTASCSWVGLGQGRLSS